MNVLSVLKEQAAEELCNKVKQLPLQMEAADVADFLGIGRSTAYNLMHSEGFPALRLPGLKRLILPKKMFIDWFVANSCDVCSDIDVLLKECEETPLVEDKET